MSASAPRLEKLSHHVSLDKRLAMINYEGLRAERVELRNRNIHRGIGFASLVEVANPSVAFHGVVGAKISAQNGVAVRGCARIDDLSDQHHGTRTRFGSANRAIVASVLGWYDNYRDSIDAAGYPTTLGRI